MGRNGSIELSPKYGVNPTISVYFWCGKEKNELALMGRVRKCDPHTGRAVKGSDVEMPMRMVLDPAHQVVVCSNEPLMVQQKIKRKGECLYERITQNVGADVE